MSVGAIDMQRHVPTCNLTYTRRSYHHCIRRTSYAYDTYDTIHTISVTPVAASIFRPLSQTHMSKREFKNGHISRFCSVFQIIQVISSAKFLSAEEVDLSFNSETKEHPQISNASFWKRDRQDVFLQMF